MRLKITTSKNATSLYVLKSTYKNGKHSSKLATYHLSSKFIEKPDFEIQHIYRALEVIAKEEAFDGFYAVCTNLEDVASAIIKINHRRWEIIQGLRDMNFYEIIGDGYIPTYTCTDFTDALHEAFGFRTDYQIVSTTQMNQVFKDTKNKKITHFQRINKKLGMPHL